MEVAIDTVFQDWLMEVVIDTVFRDWLMEVAIDIVFWDCPEFCCCVPVTVLTHSAHTPDEWHTLIAWKTMSEIMWPSAIVKPRIKKPTLDPEILTNYRPVSNLSFLSKIIEKVVARQLLDHMKKNGSLHIKKLTVQRQLCFGCKTTFYQPWMRRREYSWFS